mmetsp:Transcript_95530/g.274055  ORF Transcript_95530/g.274055 Transcript_95530/m.274055 type:complete len:349 (-) Transcript_95530:11-1057(-)
MHGDAQHVASMDGVQLRDRQSRVQVPELQRPVPRAADGTSGRPICGDAERRMARAHHGANTDAVVQIPHLDAAVVGAGQGPPRGPIYLEAENGIAMPPHHAQTLARGDVPETEGAVVRSRERPPRSRPDHRCMGRRAIQRLTRQPILVVQRPIADGAGSAGTDEGQLGPGDAGERGEAVLDLAGGRVSADAEAPLIPDHVHDSDLDGVLVVAPALLQLKAPLVDRPFAHFLGARHPLRTAARPLEPAAPREWEAVQEVERPDVADDGGGLLVKNLRRRPLLDKIAILALEAGLQNRQPLVVQGPPGHEDLSLAPRRLLLHGGAAGKSVQRATSTRAEDGRGPRTEGKA